MSCYVIGIGGTGAKCVEALIHLCSAGLMPDKKDAQGQVVGKEELYVAFVDPDGANGSLERARITLTQYHQCQTLNFGQLDLFKTPLSFVPGHDIWSPFHDDVQPTLEKFFAYNSLNTNSTTKAAAHLFDVLYSPEEKSTELDKGFRGHPSIGAAVLSATVNLGKGEPWKTFRDRIAQDVGSSEGAKIILIGSIFGGTGASGLPTIARLINNELNITQMKNSRLGGVLVLPYFSFDPVIEDGMHADAENFLLNTQAALKYYHQKANHKMGLDIFNSLYTFGEAQLSPVKVSSLGSKTQRNEPHIIELYAALACLNFFDDAVNPDGYNMIARRKQGEINWVDLPYAKKDLLLDKIEQMSRFAFAYLSSYYPALVDLQKTGGGYRVPWYINFFEKRNLSISDHKPELDCMKSYCSSFLIWLANTVTSAKGITMNLVNHNAFSEMGKDNNGKPERILRPQFVLGDFDNLLLPEGGKSPNGLNNLWSTMCIASVRDPNAVGIGKFFHALYRECGM